MRLAQRAEPLGVAVVAECGLKLAGCTALTPAPVTVVRVGSLEEQFVVCRSCLETMVREGEWEVRHARIAPRADFFLADATGTPLVAVDVKGTPRSRAVDMAQYASSLRRNLVGHGALPHVPYFLMLLVPEVGYLWSNVFAPANALPDYEVRLEEFGNVPSENGREAEAWAYGILESLLAHRIHPIGLWWTESGLQRLVESEPLRIVPFRNMPEASDRDVL